MWNLDGFYIVQELKIKLFWNKDTWYTGKYIHSFKEWDFSDVKLIAEELQ